MAYAVSHLNGAEPSVDHLAQFERKHYAKTANRDAVSKSAARRPSRSSPLVVYGPSNTKESMYPLTLNRTRLGCIPEHLSLSLV